MEEINKNEEAIDDELLKAMLEWDAPHLFEGKLCFMDCIELENIAKHLKATGYVTKANGIKNIESKLFNHLKELYLAENADSRN